MVDNTGMFAVYPAVPPATSMLRVAHNPKHEVRLARRGLSGLDGSFTWLDESGFVGEDDGLGAVVEVELGEDACDVRFDGGVADDEFAGDLGV